MPAFLGVVSVRRLSVLTVLAVGSNVLVPFWGRSPLWWLLSPGNCGGDSPLDLDGAFGHLDQPPQSVVDS